jgi:hypothetical protein
MATVTIEPQRLETVRGEARTTDVTSIPYVVPADVAATLPPAIPDRMLLGSVGDGRLKVAEPLDVVIKIENRHVIAEARVIDEFGFGGTFGEAIRDLQRAISELYFRLEEEQHRLGPDLDRIWQHLKVVFQRRP